MSDEEHYDPHWHIDRAMALLDTAGTPGTFAEKVALAQAHAAVAKSLQDVPYANDDDMRRAAEVGRHTFTVHNLYSVTMAVGRGMRVAQGPDDHDRPGFFNFAEHGDGYDIDDPYELATAILEANGWEIVSPFIPTENGGSAIVRATPEWLTRE